MTRFKLDAMGWAKIGRVFKTDGQRPWMVSHSTVPTPEHVDGDIYRIYFSPRDEKGRSIICAAVIDLNDPLRTLDLCEHPILEPGKLGTFDERGAMMSWLVNDGSQRRLFYSGWTLGQDTPWRTALGVAVSDPDPTHARFERLSEGPVLERDTVDPFFVSNPCVLLENGVWRMWYISGLPWQARDDGPALARYHICYAESRNGIDWERSGRIVLRHHHEGEVAISRPCVFRDADTYRMWYSYRGDNFGYRLGYAESPDGLDWTRFDDRVGVTPDADGWEQGEMAYPTVFRHRGALFMLYCGAGYSRNGFGLAVAAG